MDPVGAAAELSTQNATLMLRGTPEQIKCQRGGLCPKKFLLASHWLPNVFLPFNMLIFFLSVTKCLLVWNI